MPLDGDALHVSGTIIRLAMRVHSALGPGLLESAYEACLATELRAAGLRVRTQVILPVTYQGVRVDSGYRLDMLVDERVVVEHKAVDRILPVHEAQVITYLKLGDFKSGLLLNWRVARLTNGIRRFVNGA